MRTKTITTPGSQEREQPGHLDEPLDKALADTFPASDPVSSLTPDDPVPNKLESDEAQHRSR
jgi:hypothetical protein